MSVGGKVVDTETTSVRHPHVRVHGQRRLPSQRPARAALRRLPAPRPGPARRGLLPPRDGAAAGDHAGHGRQRDPHQPQPAGAGAARPVRPDGIRRVGRGLRQVGRHGRPRQERAAAGAVRREADSQLRPARPQPSLGRRLVDRQRDRRRRPGRRHARAGEVHERFRPQVRPDAPGRHGAATSPSHGGAAELRRPGPDRLELRAALRDLPRSAIPTSRSSTANRPRP